MKQRYFSPDRLSSEFDLVHSVVEWQDAKHIFTSDLKIIQGCYWQTVRSQRGGGRLFDASAKFFFTETAITR